MVDQGWDEILGRQFQLARLRQVVDGARQGNGGSLVVHGEPGVGKTALLNAAAADATGFQMLTVSGVESESDLPFGALTSLLRPAFTQLDHLPEGQRSLCAPPSASGPARRSNVWLAAQA
ncbi:MAG: AAA family ATPase [Solirubrobacteraceae bacterium]